MKNLNFCQRKLLPFLEFIYNRDKIFISEEEFHINGIISFLNNNLPAVDYVYYFHEIHDESFKNYIFLRRIEFYFQNLPF